MRPQLLVRLTSLACALLGVGPLRADDGLDTLCRRFSGFDQDGDGIVELARIEPIFQVGTTEPRVFVLVEPRLLAPLDGAEELRSRLERLAHDLARQGFRADVVAVALGRAERHQDGRYVLALRELLRAAAAEGPLAGAILVGRFPDALIVRTCNWRKQGDAVLRQGTPTEQKHENVAWLRRIPEDVAHRADIVLADLDGHWEDVYVQPRTQLESVQAVFGAAIPPTGGACRDLERSTVTFEDFFHVSDGKLEIARTVDADDRTRGHAVTLFDRSGDHECSADDRSRPNVVARPDVLISRLDARGTALRPRRDVIGEAGARLLDADGHPHAVRFPTGAPLPHWREGTWEPDAVLERRLLAEYLDLNHAYRTSTAPVAWRASSLACGLGSGYGRMRRAADDWSAEDAARADIHGDPDLVRVVEWLRYPAVLRTVRAHSDQWGSVFAKGDVAKLETAAGGAPWSWTPRDRALVPSLAAACGGGKLDWFLLRTVWENGALAPEPSLYLHTGCHGISPPGALTRPFDDPTYGVRQGAEALLFFGRGLALIGRAKVFYDEPREFAEALRDGGTFGAAWQRYFDVESRAGSWGEVGGDIGRKRAYFWSVLGDWTLTLAAGRPGGR